MDANRKDAMRVLLLLAVLFGTAPACRSSGTQAPITALPETALDQNVPKPSIRSAESAASGDQLGQSKEGYDFSSNDPVVHHVRYSVRDEDELSDHTAGPPLRIDRVPMPAVDASSVDAEPVYTPQGSNLLPEVGDDPAGHYPIDLTSVLRLAGANNLQIALARERVFEAQARLDSAELLWVPSLNGGVMYNKHDGRIQATEGDVFDVSRNSLFVGGGPVLSNSALTGGAGGPRLFVDLALADVLFQPLAARQSVRAADAEETAVFNDTLLEVSTGYLALINAQTTVAIAHEAAQNAERLSEITQAFARSGAGLEADAQRAQAELASRQRFVHAADENLAVISAELARLLRLDPTVTLFAVDEQAVALDLFDPDTPLPVLIGQGLAGRPEILRRNANIDETYARLRLEEVRPWLPNLYAGYSAGGFGGGSGSTIDSFGGRGDLDAGAVWSWDSFGLGNRARQREQESIHNQAHLTADQTRDRVAAEVTQAYHRVRLRLQQIAATRMQVRAATDAVHLNFEGIRGLALRPIEAQQAVDALANARQQHVNAVSDYNQAQFELLRAVGQPPSVSTAP